MSGTSLSCSKSQWLRLRLWWGASRGGGGSQVHQTSPEHGGEDGGIFHQAGGPDHSELWQLHEHGVVQGRPAHHSQLQDWHHFQLQQRLSQHLQTEGRGCRDLHLPGCQHVWRGQKPGGLLHQVILCSDSLHWPGGAESLHSEDRATRAVPGFPDGSFGFSSFGTAWCKICMM